MSNFNRRDFIKISGASFAGVALTPTNTGFFKNFFQKENKHLLESEAIKVPTVCEVCFWNCAGWVYKDKENNIKKIIGNDIDPHSNGRLCPRGTGGLGMYYDEDRLKTPLIRVEKDGKQVFKKATWNEAFDVIVKNMKSIEKKYGKESLALFYHGKTGPHFKHLLQYWGSDTNAKPASAQCLITREAGYIATYGAGLASPEPTDIRNTECLVLIGSHIGENMHNGHVQDVSNLIDRGGSIITVDPRFSTVASHSTKWLPIKPSTDMALLLAWMHIIINENLYDKAYVEKYTHGFEELKVHVQKYTPEWAQGITTIPVADIYKTARMMGAASPKVIIHPGRHTAWYGDDTQRTRAMAILNAILGSWGRKGGFYFPDKVKLPTYPHPEIPKPKWSWRDISQGKHKMAFAGITNEIMDHALPEYKGPLKIKGMYFVATNPLQAIPEEQKIIRALKNQDFIVAVDTMPSEITGYADVVLPEATFLERLDDIRTSQHKSPNIALRYPAVKPKYDSKPGWWIAREIGLRLGLQDFYKWETFDEVLDWQLKQVGSSLEEMKEVGVKHFPRKKAMFLEDGEDYWFNTNTGKIELVSTDFEEWKYDALPKYKSHGEVPSGFLRLIYGRLPMHTFGRTLNNPNLNDLKKEPSLWVNPKVAKIYGVANGQEVWLQNPKGKVSSFTVKVRVTERIRHDSVFLPHGFGNKGRIFIDDGTVHEMSRTYGRGISDAEMIHKVEIDPETGGTGMRNNFVTILTEKPVKKKKAVKKDDSKKKDEAKKDSIQKEASAAKKTVKKEELTKKDK
jgi:thiosulfate reductase/polysulfide reductase chain A